MLASDCVWYKDLRVLADRPGEFFPARDHSPEERVNSIVRLLLYCTLAVYLYRRQTKYLAFGLAAVAVVSLAYRGLPGGSRTATATAAARAAAGKAGRAGDRLDGVLDRPASIGGVRVGSVLRAKRRCTMSTPDNPFGNMLLSDLADDPGRPPACKYDDQADIVRDNFNRGLVRNVYDIYEKENSQRQWMINPVTTATPDVLAFARFCYGNVGRTTCKEDPSKCMGAFP